LNRPSLPIAHRSRTIQTVLSGTVYRLTSSMSDQTPVLFNVVEDWNEESVVPHISFVSFVDYSTPDSIRIDYSRRERRLESSVVLCEYSKF